jgi:5-methylcytosine-specific restriction endonuclease McrA
MSDKSFIAELRELLERNPPQNKVDRDAAFQLIKDALYLSTLRRSGPCLSCETPLEYGYPSSIHVSRGDAWLDVAFTKHKNGGDLLQYKLDTITPYLCDDCYDALETRIQQSQEAANRRAIERRTEDAQRENDIIIGKVKATPAKRYWALRGRLDSDTAADLKAMPYKKFLNTIYWDIVRNYTLYKAGYACGLCHRQGKLQVHHRTYEHRGSEIAHPGDLIVLCANCHAKFHDKLPAEQTG